MHVNEQVVRRFYEAFQKEDVSGIQTVCAPNLVWHEVGRNALSGDHRGLEQVMGFFQNMEKSLEGVEVEIHDVVANDSHVVVLENMKLHRAGKTVETKASAIFHVADGKITEGWEFREDQYGVDELLA